MRRGLFVSIEGGEGSGKSTQIALLSEALQKYNIESHTTYEPGGTVLADHVRSLLVKSQQGEEWCAESELLLFMAARVQHYKTVIMPELAKGRVVVSDRFHDSSRVYQGVARQLGVELYDRLHRMMLGNIAPDITFLLDIDPRIGLERAASRGGDETRFEELGLAFHTKLRDGFLQLAKREPQRIHLVSADQPVELVHNELMRQLLPRIQHL